MKKLLLILWLCAVVAACGGGGEEESEPNYQPGDYLPEGGYLGYDGHTWCIGLNVGYPQCQPDWEPSVPYEVQYGTIVPAPYVDKSLPVNEDTNKPEESHDLADLWYKGELFQAPIVKACSGPGNFTEYYTNFMGDSVPMGTEYCSQRIHKFVYILPNPSEKYELEVQIGEDYNLDPDEQELLAHVKFSTTESAYQSHDVSENMQRFRAAIAPYLIGYMCESVSDESLTEVFNAPIYQGVQDHSQKLPYEQQTAIGLWFRCEFSYPVNVQGMVDSLMPFVFSDKTLGFDLRFLEEKHGNGFSRTCWGISVVSRYRHPFDEAVMKPLDELYNFETNQYVDGYTPMPVDTRYITPEGTLKNSDQVIFEVEISPGCTY